jgi:hypothetical protein
MLRILKLSTLASALVVAVAMQASAATIVDPIVRTRLGTLGSIPIDSLPFFYDFYDDGTFPDNPDPANCVVGIEGSLDIVTCEFQNRTGQAITFLDFDFLFPTGTDPGTLTFVADDQDNLFATENSNFAGAQFLGGAGIPSCNFDGEFCFGGDFLIDLVGFPVGTTMTMTADAAPVPEPATLTLVATGIGMALARRRRRQL